MIRIINDIQDPLINLVKDDPVRPEILAEDRVSKNKEIIVLVEDNIPSAVVCVCYQNNVPTSVQDLIGEDNPTIAVFYTIWSYKKDAGKRLITASKDYIKDSKLRINRFVTLSPPTELARKFHLGNGAIEFKVNNNSVNYEYL